MDTIQILTEIESQIERLQSARLALLGSNPGSLNPNPAVADLLNNEQRRPGRPPGISLRKANKPKGITPDGRKRIAEAMKRRWADQKARLKKTA